MIGTTIAHYRILEVLGRGGMGIVYKALDTKLDRMVALKFLPADAEDEHRDRFLQEARAAATLSHSGICVVHAIEEHGGERFIVMEYVEGQTLRRVIQEGKVKEPRHAVTLITGVAESLGAAHARGIIHRDIKPENIIVMPDGRSKVMTGSGGSGRGFR